MSDEFFESITAQASGLKAYADDQQAIKTENEGFVEDAVASAKPLFERYADRLEQMGFQAIAVGAEESTILQLTWADRKTASIRLGREQMSNQVSLSTRDIYYDEGGSLVGNLPAMDRREWSLQKVESELQRFIRMFTDNAMEHGGI
jgi:hypothetical protein